MLSSIIRLICTVLVTVALLQACVGCTVSKAKQSRTVTVDSTHKVVVKDTTIYQRTISESGNSQAGYERVTTITPTFIRDTIRNITNVYPTTVITEKGEIRTEYVRDTKDSLAVVKLTEELATLQKAVSEKSKEKETSWPWWIFMMCAISLACFLYVYWSVTKRGVLIKRAT
jgi:hypothetical protein